MQHIDHKAFLASLTAGDRARLTETADWPGVQRLLAHTGIIAVLALPVVFLWPGWWIAVPPLGIALAFLFTLQHECTHKTPFRSVWLNEWAGVLSGLVLIQPFLWFRYFHLAHHRHTNIEGRDPELETLKPETWAAFAWHLSALGYWWSKLKVLFVNAFGRIEAHYLPLATHRRIRWEARAMLATYTVVAVTSAVVSPVLLRAWILPLAFGFPFLRLYLLAEHGRCPRVANMFDNTRTTYTNRLVHLLAWNMPYHTEHHVFPNVPFHKLQDLHGKAARHLLHKADGYSGFTRHYVEGFKG